MPRPIETPLRAVDPGSGRPTDRAKDRHPPIPDSDRYLSLGLGYGSAKANSTDDGTERGGDRDLGAMGPECVAGAV
jgi:hypothetical protein